MAIEYPPSTLNPVALASTLSNCVLETSALANRLLLAPKASSPPYAFAPSVNCIPAPTLADPAENGAVPWQT